MYLENYILKEIQDIKPQYGVEDTPPEFNTLRRRLRHADLMIEKELND
jgi:hypothetical protein